LTQMKQLIDAGLVADLTDVYDKYALPYTKQLMEQDKVGLETGKSKGRLMAIPRMAPMIDQAPFLYVRSDWLKKLNLPEPTTMDNLLAVIQAFTTKDPDGNGKADTIGLTAIKTLWGGYSGLEGFFNGYHAYPKIWIKDKNGKLAYGSIQPEIKPALAALQNLFKTGQMDKEFGVKDATKVGESPSNGKNGVVFGQDWIPISPLQNNKNNDPNAEWKSYPIPSIDGKPAMAQVNPGTTIWYVVNKKAKNPEGLIQMLNVHFEKVWGKTAEFSKYFTDAEANERFKLDLLTGLEPPRKNLETHLAIVDAMKTNDTSKMNAEAKDNYNKIMQYKSGDNKMWAYDRIFGPEGSFAAMKKYEDEGLFYINQFQGASTPAMVEKNATLLKLQDETFTKIILGESNIDEFDTFVKKWNELGGEQITKEVNDWFVNKDK